MGLRSAMAKPVRYVAFAGGAVPVLAFPRTNIEIFGWIGLVPGLILLHRAPSAREAAVRGWWFGAGYMLAATYWLAPEIGPAVLLVAAGFGALFAPFGVAARAMLRPPVTALRALAALVVVPSYWVLIEWIRSLQALGGPWAVLGASQWRHPAVLALASVGGVWLVSFVLVAVNVAITLLLVSRRLTPAAAAAAAGAAAAAAGPVIFALTPPAPGAGQVTVALVQPGLVHNPTQRANSSQGLTAGLIRRSPRDGARPDLIAWGESSVAFYLQADRSLLGRIEGLSAREGSQILVNQDSLHDGNKTKVAVLVGPHGIDGTYTKSRLVPFGEYIPFRQALSWLTSISRAAPVNMVPGDGAHVMRITLPGGRPMMIGPLICFESAFPDMSRFEADHGARFILYQTSDSTFQGTWALAQHASLGAVRAAETGRPVMQAALTGDSAAFDPRGRQLAWMSQTSTGVTTVRLTLPAASSRTPYDRLGDYVPWTAVAVAGLSALIAAARRRGLPGRKAGARGGDEAQYGSESGLHVPG